MRYQPSRPGRTFAVICAAALAGGCADTTGPDALDDQLLLDMAIVAADATLEDLGTWGRPFGFGPVGVPGLHGNGPGLAGSGPGRPGGRHGIGDPLSGTRSRTFFDVDGNEQDAYDEETTERIEFESDVSGEVSRENWTADVARTRSMTITGLAGEETHRTWNGTGTEEIAGSRHTDEGDRTYDMSGEFTYFDVVVPIPGSDPRYPISGSISRTMDATITSGDETRTRSVVMTITFDGDETATIVVNGEEMEIDLSTREGRHPLRRRGGG